MGKEFVDLFSLREAFNFKLDVFILAVATLVIL